MGVVVVVVVAVVVAAAACSSAISSGYADTVDGLIERRIIVTNSISIPSGTHPGRGPATRPRQRQQQCGRSSVDPGILS